MFIPKCFQGPIHQRQRKSQLEQTGRNALGVACARCLLKAQEGRLMMGIPGKRNIILKESSERLRNTNSTANEPPKVRANAKTGTFEYQRVEGSRRSNQTKASGDLLTTCQGIFVSPASQSTFLRIQLERDLPKSGHYR